MFWNFRRGFQSSLASGCCECRLVFLKHFQMASSTATKASALRFADFGTVPKRMLAPIDGYENMPVVSLEEAVQPLVDIVPKVERNVSVVKRNCHHPEDGLTSDESAAIMLYTLESNPHENSLYVILNTTLRSEQRQQLRPWFLYLRLILTALARLPSERRAVFRGVRLDLHDQYPMGSNCIWWSFSSCTSSVGVLESESFFGQKGTRTLFHINCLTAKDIKNHSFMQHEDEILLLPARELAVTSVLNSGNGLHIIQLEEIEPQFPLLEPVSLPTPTLPHKKNDASSSGPPKPISSKPLKPKEPKYDLPEPVKLPTPKPQLPPPKPIVPIQPLIAPNLSGQFRS